MRSIRSRLTVFLLAGIGLAIVAAGVVLEIGVARWLERELDRSVEAKARALVTLTKNLGDGGAGPDGIELDFADEFMPEFQSASDPQYFELWLDGETLLERSRSFALPAARPHSILPREPGFAGAPRFRHVRLPDGRAGRLVQIDFVPQVESRPAAPARGEESRAGEEPILDPTGIGPGAPAHVATILVAVERETLDSEIAWLRWSFAGFLALLLLVIAGLIALALKIGLRPLDRLARQVEGLDAESLDRRVGAGSPPRELAPVVEQLNGLLARLEAAFRRERQLTSDIAHELKTPIAELRSLCEVGARWPDDPATTRAFFDDASAISEHMERIVAHLLALARYDEDAEPVKSERVPLGALLADVWSPLAREAAEKGLAFESRIPPGAVLETDPLKLRLILANLLANAVEHSRPGTTITCDAADANGARALTVANHPASLDAADLPLMFDRFWRKDAARTSGHGVGLGLSIVRVLAGHLGFETTAALTPAGRLEITLRRPG